VPRPTASSKLDERFAVVFQWFYHYFELFAQICHHYTRKIKGQQNKVRGDLFYNEMDHDSSIFEYWSIPTYD
jgi:hypothetical protein